VWNALSNWFHHKWPAAIFASKALLCGNVYMARANGIVKALAHRVCLFIIDFSVFPYAVASLDPASGWKKRSHWDESTFEVLPQRPPGGHFFWLMNQAR